MLDDCLRHMILILFSPWPVNAAKCQQLGLKKLKCVLLQLELSDYGHILQHVQMVI